MSDIITPGESHEKRNRFDDGSPDRGESSRAFSRPGNVSESSPNHHSKLYSKASESIGR